MNKFNSNDIVYTFMGEELVEIKVHDYLDEIRVCGATEESNVTVYAKHCHKTRDEAISAMTKYLEEIPHE